MADTMLHVQISEEISKSIDAVTQQIKDAQLVLTEERIRQIVQEELAKYDERQKHIRRFGEQFERK